MAKGYVAARMLAKSPAPRPRPQPTATPPWGGGFGGSARRLSYAPLLSPNPAAAHAAPLRTTGMVRFWVTPGRSSFSPLATPTPEASFYALCVADTNDIERTIGWDAVSVQALPSPIGDLMTNNHMMLSMAQRGAASNGAQVVRARQGADRGAARAYWILYGWWGGGRGERKGGREVASLLDALPHTCPPLLHRAAPPPPPRKHGPSSPPAAPCHCLLHTPHAPLHP